MRFDGKILNTIDSLYSSLTKTEKHIADEIFSNPTLLNQGSLSDIATKLNVGDATLIRFARTLGFKGFSDFRLELSVELATQNMQDNILTDSEILPTDDAKNIALKLQANIQKVLTKTISLLSLDELTKAVKAFQSAKRIFLFGMGSSGVAAEYAKNKFMRIGLNIDASSNNHIIYMQASLLSKDDVALALSHSGTSIEAVHGLNIARQVGATTIALTHNDRSPLTKEADIILINGSKQGRLQGDSIGTQIAQLFVLDLIYTLLVQQQEEQAITNKQKTINVLFSQHIK